MYSIGEKVWTGGNEVTITTEPYSKYGRLWQSGTDANGTVYAVLTPEEIQANIDRERADYSERQAQFRRLKKIKAQEATK